MITVQHCLSENTILIADKATGMQSVIEQLSERLADCLGVEQNMLQNAILERESTRTTAFANGAAIPHCRLSDLQKFGMAIMILRQPVRWDNEGHAVDAVMMIAGPTENVGDHLRLMANSSQLLDSASLRAKLKRSPDPKSAYKLITTAEEAVEKHRSRDGMLRELRKDQAAGGDYLTEVTEAFDW